MSQLGTRACNCCGTTLHSQEFTRIQWARGRDFSTCINCVKGVSSTSFSFGRMTPPRRKVPITRVSFNIENIFAEGSFKYCTEGIYIGGSRAGEECVAKWFKEDNNFDEEFFARDLDAIDQSANIIAMWNKEGIVPGVKIRLNVPEIWPIGERRCMIEPYIVGFTKFNSNTGWIKRGVRVELLRILNALSHYSYHVTSGQHLICDLQGGVRGDVLTLTNPAVLSRRQKFGPADLGPKGMSNFFYHHR